MLIDGQSPATKAAQVQSEQSLAEQQGVKRKADDELSRPPKTPAPGGCSAEAEMLSPEMRTPLQQQLTRISDEEISVSPSDPQPAETRPGNVIDPLKASCPVNFSLMELFAIFSLKNSM